MLWYIGDDKIWDAVQEYVEGKDWLSSAAPNATPEEVWTTQLHDADRRWKDAMTVILYLPQQDYDSEATLWRILSKIPVGSRVIYCMSPDSPRVHEGLDHYDNPNVTRIELNSTDKDEVLAKLRAA